jgi:hypothetical protein
MHFIKWTADSNFNVKTQTTDSNISVTFLDGLVTIKDLQQELINKTLNTYEERKKLQERLEQQ